MTRKPLLIALFVAAAVLQLGVPASMVYQYEHTLGAGKPFKFRCRPVDPYDAFRGRYVALGFDDVSVKWTDKERPKTGEQVHAVISVDKDGYASLSTASRDRSVAGDYLTVEVSYAYDEKNVTVKYPFDHYYMREDLAPKAETVYREHSGREVRDAYTLVRILNGKAVIENVYVGAQTLEDAAKGLEQK